MKHLWVLIALALPLALATLIAGGALAHDVGTHPDLVVSNVSTEPAPPTPGEEVTVRATVENQGDQQANDFEYTFHLDGQELGVTQTWGDEDDEDNLAPGDDVTLNATATWSVSVGDHATNVSVAHQDGITTEEHATGNNEAEQAYTIGADLAVTDVTVDPTDPIEGDAVTFEATIENQADPEDTATSAGSFEAAFLVDGDQATTGVTVSGLDAGESETVTRTWTASGPGTHGVRAVADAGETVPDLDRSNNDAGPVTVDVRPALPDLVVADVSYTPDPVEPGREATFTATISNNGPADAGEHDVALLVDDQTVDTSTLTGIDQGGQDSVSLDWQATSGSHDVEVVVDADDNQTETNEDNNAWTLSLPVGADLVVREFVVQPSEPRASDRVRFTLEIGNAGLGVDESFQVAFDVDGEPHDSVEVPGLGADGVRNVTSNAWNASVGDHEITAIIDPDGTVGEVDDENNQHTQQLTVGEPRPDIAVLSAGLNSSFVEDGDPVTVQAQLHNAGPRDAEAFTLTARIDGEQIGQAELDGLAAGEQPTLDLANWTASAGAHELVVEADPDGGIEELSEDNNEFVRSFGIGMDLALVDVSLSPADPEPGDEVTALAIVQNNGTQRTPTANVSFQLEGGEVGNATLDPLDPNEQTSVEATFTATLPGELETQLDADEDLDEFDEDNNVGSVQLSVAGDAGPPDLTVRSVSVDGDVSSGEPVRLTARIANVGEGPSTQALVDFRVDGSSIGPPASVEGLAAGTEANVTGPEWTPSSDEHELEVTVDVDEQVDESDETNNVHTEQIEGGPVGLPLGPGSAAIALLAAAIALRGARGSKRKPPKT